MFDIYIAHLIERNVNLYFQ